MNVYGCQLNIVWEDKAKNFTKIRNLLGRKMLPAGSMVVLPEMCATGFSMNTDKIAEGADGPTTKFIRELARELGVYVVGGVVRRGPGKRIFNEAVCISPSGKRVARYDKLHLFSPGGEAQHYTPGGRITLFRCGNLKVALYVCYDLRFPEIFRQATLRGAEVLVVIANWPSRRRHHWSALLQARAIENQLHLVASGYDIPTAIYDRAGEALVKAKKDPEVVVCEIDLNARQLWYWLGDWRSRIWREGPPRLQDKHESDSRSR